MGAEKGEGCGGARVGTGWRGGCERAGGGGEGGLAFWGGGACVCGFTASGDADGSACAPRPGLGKAKTRGNPGKRPLPSPPTLRVHVRRGALIAAPLTPVCRYGPPLRGLTLS